MISSSYQHCNCNTVEWSEPEWPSPSKNLLSHGASLQTRRDVLPLGRLLRAWHGHCHGSHLAVLPGGSDLMEKNDVMGSSLWKLLGRPVEHIFFGVSMAAWLDDLCQWWGGEVVRRLKGIITGGICLEEMLAQWSEDPMWFWNPAHLSQVGPGSWLRMVRDKNRTEEAQVFLGLW